MRWLDKTRAGFTGGGGVDRSLRKGAQEGFEKTVRATGGEQIVACSGGALNHARMISCFDARYSGGMSEMVFEIPIHRAPACAITRAHG